MAHYFLIEPPPGGHAKRSGLAEPAGQGEEKKIVGAALPKAVVKELEPRVLICDASPLRGSGIKGLLREWAEHHGVELELRDPSSAEEDAEPLHTYRLGILSLGHLSVGDRVALGWLIRLRRQHPDTPLVIWSDRSSPQEAYQSLQHGARGFVPTATTPQLAMQALSFIMSGGTFFPPEALTSIPHHDDDERDPPSTGRSETDGGPIGFGRTLLSHSRRQRVVVRQGLGIAPGSPSGRVYRLILTVLRPV